MNCQISLKRKKFQDILCEREKQRDVTSSKSERVTAVTPIVKEEQKGGKTKEIGEKEMRKSIRTV